MNNDQIKSKIMKRVLELTEELKNHIHSVNIEFSPDDKKIIVDFNI
jgi:hypothetical protein